MSASGIGTKACKWQKMVASSLSAACPRSKQPRSVGHGLVRCEQGHGSALIGEAKGQDLRHELPDLARGEIDHGGDLAAGQVFDRVIFGDLGAGLPVADGRTEIDQQFVGGLARLRIGFGRDDRADADVDLQEIIEADRVGGRGAGIVGQVHGATLTVRVERSRAACLDVACPERPPWQAVEKPDTNGGWSLTPVPGSPRLPAGFRPERRIRS